MAYHIEGKDIVIDGWEKGISDSPYLGISDMRGMNIISVPGEASVNFDTSLNTPVPITTGTVTGSSSSTMTFTGATGLINGQAIYFTAQTALGVTLNIPYWVRNLSGSTFKLYNYFNGGSYITTTDGGTGTFTSYNMATPKHYAYDDDNIAYYLQDSLGQVWANLSPADTSTYWVYTGNYQNSNVANSNGNGLIYFKRHLFSFSNFSIDYLQTGSLSEYYSAVNWVYGWDPTNSGSGATSPVMNTPKGTNNPHNAILGPGNTVYYVDGQYVGSWFPTNTSTLTLTGSPGATAVSATLSGAFSGVTGMYWVQFSNKDKRPVKLTNGATTVNWVTGLTANCPNATITIIFSGDILDSYSFQKIAIETESWDINQCLTLSGNNLLIGGSQQFIYVWDRVQSLYSYRIFLPESNIQKMETINNTTYIFPGNRGRIYQTNGSQASLYKKIPDHLADTIEPYFTWGGVASYKNQLYFGVSASTNAGTTISNYGGLWAIDVDTGALRLTNKLSYNDYTGRATLIIPILKNYSSGNPSGAGLYIGFASGASFSTTYGVDLTISTPYTNYESYVDSDMIPIATYLTNRTFEQVEFKLSVPMVSGEGVKIQYRTNITGSWTDIFETLYSATSESNADNMSGLSSVNWQNVQWIQLRTYVKSTASSPSYTRLKEIRIR